MLRPLLLIATLVMTACGSDTEVDDQAGVSTDVSTDVSIGGSHSADASIEWFGGSIQAAFDSAESEAKPVFLYWGAVWCPPCQEIKHTVFKSQEFIRLTRLFVPVYLDGDTDEAQAWGEKFGVKGYPTMIVFNSAGEEMTRIPGGIDISRYNTVLELSLNQMRSTADLVQIALADSTRLSADEFYQLAYYSWFQDTSAVPDDTDKAELFLRLSTSAPEGELSNRFYMNYLLALTEKNDLEETGQDKLDPAIARRLEVILSSTSLTLASWDSLAYYMEEILALPVIDDAHKASLAELWANSIFDLRFDEALSRAEKLAGWVPKLQLATRDDQPLAEDLREILQAELKAADEATPDSFERQSVINQISHIYREAGLVNDAKGLLLAELEKSASPYYFMSGLGSLAEKDDHFEEALAWRKRAYENSVGVATRFQWGANYVLAMIRMAPEDHQAIAAGAKALLSEFDVSGELFAGRNFRILKRLNDNLRSWREEQKPETLTFEPEVEKLCDDQKEASLQQQNCRSLF
ncbi:MAG: thioredoxin fold domain-containing protein, partial [Gammaproteobacteria bacterium]|nr:thioredoxin fold domain-containing protein [Gammaproteobacteria bacterium]